VKVLSVASEIFPLVKTGGLADVTGALPKALAQHGLEVRTLVPGYPVVRAALDTPEPVRSIANLFGGPARLLQARAADLDLIVIDAPHLYDRPGNPYLDADGRDWPDNSLRFAALAAAAAEIARGAVSGFQPDIVHAHDWQAGLTPAYLKYGPPTPVKSVVTIHNIAFQGQFPAEVFQSLGLPEGAFAIDGVEYFGGVGYLKAALQYADAITTVSPTYADEIRGAEFGMGLDGLLQFRQNDLHGIINGIDTVVWNPATDGALAQRYDSTNLGQRALNKRAIEQKFGLARDDRPLYCVISRLTWQKGMDLLAGLLDRLAATGARLALLGTGDRDLEHAFREAASRDAGRVGVLIGYDDAVAHQLLGGADAILVPSRFEPCGLTQLQGLRYGCVPLVARVGGLADTGIDANDAAVSAGTGNGVQFAPVNATSLDLAIQRTNRLFCEPETWRQLQLNGMGCDVSWQRSAGRYVALFQSLRSAPTAALTQEPL
jgi:starch synthase